jgi:hypothetical protein
MSPTRLLPLLAAVVVATAVVVVLPGTGRPAYPGSNGKIAFAVAGTSDGVQTLRPLVQMSVSAAGAHGGGTNVKGEAG